nr:hypothetical protein [uncultured Cohaesibacter sp.]
MMLLRLFGITLVGFWRLIIGIILGTILYIYCFLYQEQIYTNVHAFSRNAIDWLDHQPYILAYAKWFELLKIDDKLSFALYVLFGRLAWMLLESIWLFLYRKATR